LLALSGMPVRFWDEAFHSACYLINRMPSKVISGDTPMFHLLGLKPDYKFLRVFGCSCWPNLRPYNPRKLDLRSKQCTFVGYSANHKGYKCLDRQSGRVFISRDVVFDESVFPFKNNSTHCSSAPHNSNQPTVLPSFTPLSHYTEQFLTDENPTIAQSTNPENPLSDSTAVGNISTGLGHTNTVADHPIAATYENAGLQTGQGEEIHAAVPETPQAEPSAGHRMQTRLKNNIVRPKQFRDGTARYGGSVQTSCIPMEPRSHEEALKHKEWKQAMDAEYSALVKNETWSLVPPQRGMNLIDCKWVFKVKKC
jgi:hypothetical protein